MQRALLAFALSLVCSACIIVEDDPTVVNDPPDTPLVCDDSSITIENRSTVALTEIRVTEVDNQSWGPNLINRDLLLPNEMITVQLASDTYDVLVVDEYEASCELHDLDLCFEDAIWTITDQTLESCRF